MNPVLTLAQDEFIIGTAQKGCGKARQLFLTGFFQRQAIVAGKRFDRCGIFMQQQFRDDIAGFTIDENRKNTLSGMVFQKRFNFTGNPQRFTCGSRTDDNQKG